MNYFENDASKEEKLPKYNECLRAPVFSVVSQGAPRAKVHSTEWVKVMAGEPIEINKSVGEGYKVMTVAEYTSRWKRNDDLPDCLSCGSMETKEHHFVQCWCRGKRLWESETFCTVCHAWSWRSYADPEFMMPETFEKLQWETRAEDEEARKVKALASQPGARSSVAAA